MGPKIMWKYLVLILAIYMDATNSQGTQLYIPHIFLLK